VVGELTGSSSAVSQKLGLTGPAKRYGWLSERLGGVYPSKTRKTGDLGGIPNSSAITCD
jgi:hypothetical protein